MGFGANSVAEFIDGAVGDIASLRRTRRSHTLNGTSMLRNCSMEAHESADVQHLLRPQLPLVSLTFPTTSFSAVARLPGELEALRRLLPVCSQSTFGQVRPVMKQTAQLIVPAHLTP